ncbi:MAG TPA: hypothetical protein VFA30_08175 [Gaiellaceae bacterium]|nr:hypothetical protein [Gaiellaceae bacterium]
MKRGRLPLVVAAGALLLAGCTSHTVKSGEPPLSSGALTAPERHAAQTALDGLQNSNISFQLVSITKWVQNVPATCRVGLVSRNPTTFAVYVFWIPWLAAEPYAWLNMQLTNDPRTSTFHLGTVEPVLSGGRLEPNGRKISPGSIDTTLLSRYGAAQARKGREIMTAHAEGVFAKPGVGCQVLQNGALRLLPG